MIGEKAELLYSKRKHTFIKIYQKLDEAQEVLDIFWELISTIRDITAC